MRYKMTISLTVKERTLRKWKPKKCHGDILAEIANKLIEAEAYFNKKCSQGKKN